MTNCQYKLVPWQSAKIPLISLKHHRMINLTVSDAPLEHRYFIGCYENVFETVDARLQQAEKRSLFTINEHS